MSENIEMEQTINQKRMSIELRHISNKSMFCKVRGNFLLINDYGKKRSSMPSIVQT